MFKNVASLGIVLTVTMPSFGAKDWSPTPSAPVLSPNKITVGLSDPFGNGATIIVQKGEKVTLSADATDNDTWTDATTGGTSPDTTTIEWSKSGGTFNLSPARGKSIEWTAPTTTGTYTVTATPDDASTADPGSRPAGDTGNRNDSPNAGGAVTINMRVIDSCPTDIAMTGSCSLPNNWANYWAAVYPGAKTRGFITTLMTVSGGAPPNPAPPAAPPNNWDGTYIKEFVTLHSVDDGDAVAADFVGGLTPANFCTATVEGFVVGISPGSITSPGVPPANTGVCARAATLDSFWDDHAVGPYGVKILVGAAGTTKTVICEQKYKCKDTTLNVGANNRFKITRSFSNVTYTPPTPDDTLTQVTITKAAD
jgi:hypothetical protein